MPLRAFAAGVRAARRFNGGAAARRAFRDPLNQFNPGLRAFELDERLRLGRRRRGVLCHSPVCVAPIGQVCAVRTSTISSSARIDTSTHHDFESRTDTGLLHRPLSL